MALSFTKKRKIQKELIPDLERLDSEDLGFKEKREVQKRVIHKVSLLTGDAERVERSLLDKLNAGEFDGLEPLEFLKKLKAIVDDETGGDIEPIKEPTVRYIDTQLKMKAS